MAIAGDRVIASAGEQRVGTEVRRLREQAGLSVRTLAEVAGFSASFISQLEHGHVSASIASLGRIAAALGVNLADLFTPSEAPGLVVRAVDRPTFKSTWSKARIQALIPTALPHALDALMIMLEPGGSSGKRPTGVPNEQVAVVFAGRVELTLREDCLELRRGDAVLIPARTPHRWHNPGRRFAHIVLVSTRSGR